MNWTLSSCRAYSLPYELAYYLPVFHVGPAAWLATIANGDLIPSELVVWVAGLKGPDVLGKMDGFEVSRSNQLVIKPTLQTTSEDNIFALGDCAYPSGYCASDRLPRILKRVHRESRPNILPLPIAIGLTAMARKLDLVTTVRKSVEVIDSA